MNSASPFARSSLSIGIRFADAIVFWPRHQGFRPTSDPRDNQVRYADTASTSLDVCVGNSSGDSLAPVAFSLRKKQSTMRSPRLKRRPDRRLYSGNMPVTPTSGSDFSRCPAFKWQLLHDILLGAKFGTSVGVFVKILNPQRISFESCEPSNCLSLSGSLGSSQAVTMVVAAGISGPRSGIPDAV